MKISAVVAAAACFTLAAAEPLFFTQPVAETVWTAGQNATVSWRDRCTGSATGAYPVLLYKNGADGRPAPFGAPELGQINCLTSNAQTVRVPANIETGSTYSVFVPTTNATGPDHSYSAVFRINGVAPSSTNSAPSAGPTNSSTTPTVTRITTTTSPTSTPNGSKVVQAGSTFALVALAISALLM